jgi:hypothetical protein
MKRRQRLKRGHNVWRTTSRRGDCCGVGRVEPVRQYRRKSELLHHLGPNGCRAYRAKHPQRQDVIFFTVFGPGVVPLPPIPPSIHQWMMFHPLFRPDPFSRVPISPINPWFLLRRRLQMTVKMSLLVSVIENSLICLPTRRFNPMVILWRCIVGRHYRPPLELFPLCVGAASSRLPLKKGARLCPATARRRSSKQIVSKHNLQGQVNDDFISHDDIIALGDGSANIYFARCQACDFHRDGISRQRQCGAFICETVRTKMTELLCSRRGVYAAKVYREQN